MLAIRFPNAQVKFHRTIQTLMNYHQVPGMIAVVGQVRDTGWAGRTGSGAAAPSPPRPCRKTTAPTGPIPPRLKKNEAFKLLISSEKHLDQLVNIRQRPYLIRNICLIRLKETYLSNFTFIFLFTEYII